MDVTNDVLIVDDEKMIRDAVSAYFTKMGCHTYQADNGRDALALFERTPISFVILDLMLPGMSGEDVCREIRKKSRVPIIMLTAKTQEESILNGLHIGADDYVTKPFSVKQLYARMEAVMRRVSDEYKSLTERLIWQDDLVIDFEEATVRKKGLPLSLTKSEWKILSSMASYPKKVFTRDELMEITFGGDADSFDRVIDTHIKNLRKKLE
ncbi:MAG: response regulator transcription factor, partial [Lachnospiraceae bacterium]|nr:response regulator transcription factor [Lachnospiraceae bacterium]